MRFATLRNIKKPLVKQCFEAPGKVEKIPYKTCGILMILEPKRKMTSKLSMNCRIHKVFINLLGCFNIVLLTFFMFRKVAKRIQLLLKTLMFWYLLGIFAKVTPEISIKDRFYKVFWTTFLEAPKRCFTNCFLVLCKVVKRHQLSVKNLMPF